MVLTGRGFSNASHVTFGGIEAKSFRVDSDTQITAVDPNHGAGSVPVTVAGPFGSSNGATFSYVGIPSVTSLNPAAGPLAGGQRITVSGTNFVAGATVRFGKGTSIRVATGVDVVSPTKLTVLTPAVPKKGAYALQVVTPGGESPKSSGARYKYVTTPGVVSVSPATGPITGGQSVTISGYGFVQGAKVTFGSVPASNVVVVSSTKITATTPMVKKATTSVVHVTTSTGRSRSNPGDTYGYTKSG